MYSETHCNATQSHRDPSARNRPSADSLRRFFGVSFVAVTFAVGICSQPHVSFISPHRPGAVHRVDIQPVVAPGRPSRVSFAQAAPASGALRRHAALFRFKPDRNGLPATPVPELTPRVAGWTHNAQTAHNDPISFTWASWGVGLRLRSLLNGQGDPCTELTQDRVYRARLGRMVRIQHPPHLAFGNGQIAGETALRAVGLATGFV